MPSLTFSRQTQFGNTQKQYIAGSLVAGVIVLVVSLCIIHFRRTKTNKRWQATVLCLESNPETSSLTSYNRVMSIDPPEKRDNPSDHSSEFTPYPSSTHSLHVAPPSHSVPPFRPAHIRHSRASSGFSGFTMYNQYRFPPGLTRYSHVSFVSFVSPSRARPAHQAFEPTLPDELTLRCGEYITVLRSFDDGWCVVARDTSPSSPMSLWSGTTTNGDNVDIGIVPAWVFAEPLEGVTCTRSFRSTSLNALRFGQNPGYARDTMLADFAW